MSENVTRVDDFDVDPTLRYIDDHGQITAAGYDAGRYLDELHPAIDWITAAADLDVHVVVARRLHHAYRHSRDHADEAMQHSLF